MNSSQKRPLNQLVFGQITIFTSSTLIAKEVYEAILKSDSLELGGGEVKTTLGHLVRWQRLGGANADRQQISEFDEI